MCNVVVCTNLIGAKSHIDRCGLGDCVREPRIPCSNLVMPGAKIGEDAYAVLSY